MTDLGKPGGTHLTHVAIVGLGYVGLPLAISLANAGHRVVGFDIDRAVIADLIAGKSPIQGISHDDLLRARTQRVTWTASPNDLAECSDFLICVPTPLGIGGSPDLSFIESAARLVGGAMRPGALVILESSTHPGTTEEIVCPLLEYESGLIAEIDFDVAYSPERIDPGNDSFSVTNTPKIVGALGERAARRAADLYQSVGISVVRAKGIREAELAKLLENTYRHVNIALVNELVKFCRPLGIDLWDAIRCAQTKPFGFEAFFPGPGVGGHCIPVDPHYLSHQVRLKLGRPFRFVELAQEINSGMPAYVVERLQEELNLQGLLLRGSQILLLGVTYKRDVADLRETPARDVVRLLRDGGAIVHFSDPYVDEWFVDDVAVQPVKLSDAAGYQATVLLQDHSAFDHELIVASGTVILDTRATLKHPQAVRL